MQSTHLNLSRRAALAFALLSFLCRVSALGVEYCSNLNTAATDPTYWQFQSNGWCHDHCVSDYAFAIIQGFNCWCSNYAPGVTSSSSNCNTRCPGYNEFCGGNGYYGYIALNQAPAGTVGASGSEVSSTPVQQVTVTASGVQVTIFSTVTPSYAQIQSTSYTLFSSTSNSIPTTAPNPDSTSMSWVPTPITSVETVTGQVRTITITPTSPPTAGDNSGAFEQTTGHGLSTGQAVGLTIGLVALIVLISAIAFFCVRKRRQSAAGDQYDDVVRGDGSSSQIPKRTMSESSRYMLGTDGRQVVEGWEPQTEVAGSRRSRLIPVDPRLDPYSSVYQRGDGSKSRESVATIRDDQDYSRRFHNGRPILRATNPDE